MRAARTDKGVSAVGQVVSLKMMVEPEGIIERINAALPPALCVLGMRRVTNGFDARKLCDKRRYEYVMPAFAFNPAACRERQWYYDEAEAAGGRARAAASSASAATSSAAAATADPAAESAGAVSELPVVSSSALPASDAAAAPSADTSGASGSVPEADPQHAAVPLSSAAGAGADAVAASLVSNPEGVAQGTGAHPPGSAADRGGDSFVFDDECVRKMDAILRRYQGTHAFHNFTVKVPAGSPEAKRYILSFNCTGTFELDVRAQSMPSFGCVMLGVGFSSRLQGE